MTAATLTPAATAADLLDELRQLLGRHDGASTLDEVRELADELTGLVRRTRGRIRRMTPKPEQPADRPAEQKPAPVEADPCGPETVSEAGEILHGGRSVLWISETEHTHGSAVEARAVVPPSRPKPVEPTRLAGLRIDEIRPDWRPTPRPRQPAKAEPPQRPVVNRRSDDRPQQHAARVSAANRRHEAEMRRYLDEQSAQARTPGHHEDCGCETCKPSATASEQPSLKWPGTAVPDSRTRRLLASVRLFLAAVWLVAGPRLAPLGRCAFRAFLTARRAVHSAAARWDWFDRFYTRTASARAWMWRRFGRQL